MIRYVVLVLLIAIVDNASAYHKKKCSVGYSGTLKMFNRKMYRKVVELPCSYRLAEFRCARYNVKVTATSKMDDHGNFHPDEVQVRVEQRKRRRTMYWEGLADDMTLKTKKGKTKAKSWKIIARQGRVKQLKWLYDKSRKAAVVSVEKTFDVAFHNFHDNVKRTGVRVTCFKKLAQSQQYPASLCGDGKSDVVSTRLIDVIPHGINKNVKLFNHDILNQDIIQTAECEELADVFQSCPESKKAQAIGKCAFLAIRSKIALCVSKVDATIVDNYQDCVDYFCNDNADACTRLKAAVDEQSPCPKSARRIVNANTDC